MGTFSFYATDLSRYEEGSTEMGGILRRLVMDGDVARTELIGPPNPIVRQQIQHGNRIAAIEGGIVGAECRFAHFDPDPREQLSKVVIAGHRIGHPPILAACQRRWSAMNVEMK